MKHAITLAAALAACLSASASAATTDVSATLNVKVSVEVPACSITLANGGQVNIGASGIDDLNKDSVNRMGFSDTRLDVACPAATAVAMTVTDGNAGTVPAGIAGAIDPQLTTADLFGLGTTSKGNVGAYAIMLKEARRNDSDSLIMEGESATGPWKTTEFLRPGNGHLFAWGTPVDGGTPAALMSASATLRVMGAVVGLDNIDIQETTEFKGRATITLVSL